MMDIDPTWFPTRGHRILLQKLKIHLAEHGVTLTDLSRQETFSITKHWTSAFATRSDNLTEIRGSKAVDRWLSMRDDHLILLFLSQRIAAFPISTNHRPCTAHGYVGPAIDLSEFNELEFAVFPKTYDWTLVHTHEDYAFGGPYFIDRVAPE